MARLTSRQRPPHRRLTLAEWSGPIRGLAGSWPGTELVGIRLELEGYTRTPYFLVFDPAKLPCG